MTENREQDQTLSDVVAERVRELRKAHGWNVDALAERCAEAGRPALTAHVIETIESGRRTPDGRRRRDISVDELHALAAALGVQPLALLTGHEDAGGSEAVFVLGVAEAVIRGSADRVGALRARLAGQGEDEDDTNRMS